MSSLSKSLSGQTVLITGGVKNLGGETALALAKLDNPNFVLHYHSSGDKAKGEAIVKELEKIGSKAIIVQGELHKPADVAKIFDAGIKEFGGIDIAINNVGKNLKKQIIDVTEEEYDNIFNINGKSSFFFLQEAGKKLNDNGKIVMILTSLLAAYTPNYSTYAGAKAATEHYVRAASKEFAKRGIAVASVAPGPMDTPFFYAEEDEKSIAYLKSVALHGQLTKVENIIPLIQTIVTDGWWVSGSTIFANGGFATR